jgi:hypothetical protein
MKNKYLKSIVFGLCWVTLASPLVVPPGFSQETQRKYLSGLDKDNTVPWKFFCTAGRQSAYWTNLPVPSNWELHGFGTLNYSRDNTNTPIEQGRYEQRFTVPADWSGGRVFLVFDGVMTDTRATVNGQSAGPMHQGSFYRFKYDVTQLLQYGGENQLEVTVDKHSANASVNRAERQGDYWLFGGIYRPVFLLAVPTQFIERVAIDARADGAFAMDVFVSGRAGADAVEAQITTLDGQRVGTAFAQTLGGEQATLKIQLAAPRPWTAETPHLYRVEVRLKQGDKILHRVQQRFGFRTMEVREGDGLYVNGQRVTLQGCNRHSAWPDSGRCLSEAVHRLDINLMKDMNMNAVRMSHYPPDEQFLDLCDELGLYVLDELGGWQKCYDAEVGRKLVEEMIVRDVNHPSILFWDNGNEGGWNRELDGDFSRWDPQRRRVLHPWEKFSGINTAHYRPYPTVEQICSSNMIYLPTEFLHGLYDGGAGAGMEDFWGLMRQSKMFGGGFLWALLDEGIKRPDNVKIDVVGNLAPDGIVGPYRQKEASFYTIKELWSPIIIGERTLPSHFTGTLSVENRYSFTDASQCGFTWQLRKFRSPSEPVAGFTVIAEGQAQSPAILPGHTGSLKLILPSNWIEADALALRANDPTGRELWTWVWPSPKSDSIRNLTHSPTTAPVTASETANALEIKTGNLTVQFSQQTGQLIAAQRGTQKFSLANGPRLATGEAKLASLTKKTDGVDCVVTATYTGDLKSVTWRVRGNGWVQCDYIYTAEGPKDFLGVVFDYPEQLVKHKKWLGDGPYRVWKNRRQGVTLNVWENDYNNTITGWDGWVYPEFKGCYANVRWLQLETTEGLITAVPGHPDLFVQVLTPEFPPKNLQAKTTVSLVPQAGLAFLHAIPPIGSKFHTPKDSGPQGQPTQASGEYTGSVSFHFGALPQSNPSGPAL